MFVSIVHFVVSVVRQFVVSECLQTGSVRCESSALCSALVVQLDFVDSYFVRNSEIFQQEKCARAMSPLHIV